jgi:hypothetical protein
MNRFREVDLLQPWDGRAPGARLRLRRWLAVRLIARGVAWPVRAEEWRR